MSRRFHVPTASPLYIVMLGTLSALPPFGTDASLPGLASMEAQLGVSTAGAAQTLTLFLLGFAAGPVLFGPLSDRYGRKPILLFGLALFGVAALGCAMAGSIHVLLALRVLQGFGAGAAAALPAAIVRDVFHGGQGLSRQSYVAAVNGVAPLIAPLIGAAVLAVGGWRSIHLALAAGAGVLFIVYALGYAETLPHDATHGRRSHVLDAALTAYRHVLGDRQYRLATGLLASTFGTLFAYISGSAAVFMDMLGVSSTTYGLLFALTAAGMLCGSTVNARLAGRIGHERLLAGATLASLLMTALLLAAACLGVRSVGVVAGCVLASNFCAGVVLPNATHLALRDLGPVAGSAAALQRALQMVGGICAGSLLAWLPGDRLIAMAAVMVLFAVLSLAFEGARSRAFRMEKAGSPFPGISDTTS